VSGNVSDLNIVSNVNMLHTANTASIKLNSNVVTEFPRSKKLIKYPRVALTTAANNAYENGYKITYSSHYPGDHYPHEAFDNEKGSESLTLWYSGDNNHYNTSDGSAITDPNNADVAPKLDTNTDYGDWIGIELPSAIELKYFDLYQQYNTQNHFPQSATIYARKLTSDSWTEIYRYDDASRENEPNRATRFTVDSIIAYKYFALVGRQRNQETTGSSGISLGQWELYGVPEYDPDAHGTDVVVKSEANVPNTDWLEVYYEGKNYTNGSTVQDETSNDIDATIGAATTFDSVNKAWSFSGASNRDGNEFVSGSLPSDFEGNQIHSVSMWLKFDYWHEGAFCIIGKVDRLNNDNHKAIHFQFQGTSSASPRILYDFWDNQKSFYLPDDVQPGKWLHMTATYTGNAALRKMFVNGQELTTFITNSNYATALALDTTNDLVVRLGSRFPVNSSYIFHGDIANFRLFNRALTSDEIYQLYAYQKEYFGHGDLSMTLKAGRLGIGTSEPRGVLDVRGDMYGGCPVFFTAYAGDNGTVTGSSAGTVIVFNTTTVNKGGAYDTSNGRCTFPVSGYYEVFFRGGTAGTADFHAKIYRNGIAPGSGDWPNHVSRLWDASGSTYRNAGTIQFFYYFKAGEYIEVRLTNNSVFNADNYNSFSVKYLSN
jgi:hypothetical protein